jgi:metaxin
MTVALKSFFSHFPLHAYPPILSTTTTNVESLPSLWIHPPLNPYSNLLSSDVECLKWQAYLALRNISNIFVRWDVAADGGIGGRLPNFHVPSNEHAGKLLDAHMIPGWVDATVPMDVLEGYRDEIAKNESRAWISLLESTVHAALVSNL